MNEIVIRIQFTFAAMGRGLSMILGGFDGILRALILFVIMDYITGLMVAIIQRKLSGEAGFNQIAKKVVIFFLVAIAHVIDLYIIRTESVIRTAVILFYLYNEGNSILKNVSLLGLPIPKKLKDIMEQLKEKDEMED